MAVEGIEFDSGRLAGGTTMAHEDHSWPFQKFWSEGPNVSASSYRKERGPHPKLEKSACEPDHENDEENDYKDSFDAHGFP